MTDVLVTQGFAAVSHTAGVPSPNKRSNTTRGFTCVGSGSVGEAHEIELV